MKKLPISSKLEEKIYDLKLNDSKNHKVTSYFPLSFEEKQEILKAIPNSMEAQMEFKSIFSDSISEEDWNNSKGQIKKKFQDELLDID